MRISRKVRDEAIALCDAMANDYAVELGASCLGVFGCAAEDLGAYAYVAIAGALSARGAYPYGGDASIFDDLCFEHAEAAALLRDGWSPGDPVHLLAPTHSTEV
jgi:hypothetical protein